MRTLALIILTMVLVLGGCQKRSEPLVQPVASVSAAAGQAATAPTASPTTKEGWIALGNTRMDSQAFAEAILAYQRALELDPTNVDVRVDMGTCYRGVGQPEKAIEEYQKAIKINPRHPNAWRNSGVVYAYDLGKNAEAVRSFEKYLEVLPTAADALPIKADIIRLKGGK